MNKKWNAAVEKKIFYLSARKSSEVQSLQIINSI